MVNENKIRILYVQPGKYPEERFVVNELHPLQQLVGGDIQAVSATVNFGFYRKSASVCQPHMLPSPLKQKIPPWRRVPTSEKQASASAFSKGRWISGRSKRPIPTVTKCRR